MEVCRCRWGGPRCTISGSRINDDPVVAPDAKLGHRSSEIFRAREHMRRGMRAITDSINVEVARAWNMLGEIFVAPAAPTRGHVPAGIHHDEVGFAKVLRQPVGRYQRVHGARIGASRDCC